MEAKLDIHEIEEIERIIRKLDCPFDCRCYKSGFKNLCGGMLTSDGKLVECIDENANKCQHSFPFGSGFLCTCPLRVYIARHFHK